MRLGSLVVVLASWWVCPAFAQPDPNLFPPGTSVQPGPLDPLAAPSPQPSVRFDVPARVIHRYRGIHRSRIYVDKGATHGVSVGDQVRTLDCRRQLAVVVEVTDDTAAAELETAVLEEPDFPDRISLWPEEAPMPIRCGGTADVPLRVEGRVYVTGVTQTPTRWRLHLDSGARAGIRTGDAVRFACADALEARVEAVAEYTSVAWLPRDATAEPCQLTLAEVTLNGQPSSPARCPAPVNPPQRLEAKVTASEARAGWWHATLDKGARDGLPPHAAAQLPCHAGVYSVADIAPRRSVVKLPVSEWPEPPGAVWINLNDTVHAPFCFHTAKTCVVDTERARDR